MHAKKILGVMIILFLFTALTMATVPVCQAAQKYTLKTLSAWPKTSFEVKQFIAFIEIAQKEADQKYPGELKIDYKGAGEVIHNREQVEACRSGLIDMVMTATSYYTSIMPEMDTMSLTTMRPWEERKAGVFDYLEKLHNAKANAHFLGRLGTGSLFHLFLAKPIKKVDDLKGMKIRCSPTHIPLMKSLGAEPIGMPPTDIYTAMDRGVVDGYIQPPGVIRDFGLVKISKYIVFPGFYEPIITVLVNLDVWNKLPQHLKDLLTENVKKAERFAVGNIQKRVDSEFEAFKKEGMIFIEMSPPEAAKFARMADDALLGVVMKKASKEAKRIKQLITR